jgi:flagellar biosynthetic protein FlhB
VSESSGEKTFEATPQKRDDARKEGRFAKSRDIGAVVATGSVLALTMGSREAIGRTADTMFRRCCGDLAAVQRGDYSGVRQAVLEFLLVSAVPAAALAAVVSAASGLAQSGAAVNFDVIAFKPERLNPFPQLGQLFSPRRGSVEVLIALLRVLVVGYVVYRALLLELPAMLSYDRLSPVDGAAALASATVRIVTSALCALGAIAVIDYVKSSLTLSRDLRMSRQEIIDESRSRDGDPKVKGRMRARARALARKRSLANVKTATVVIANPTHISVALRYRPTDPAPIVVSKGHDEMAMLIRKEARRHGIPILENRPLARALDAEVAIGHPVPSNQFAAVARILAFVYRLRGYNGTRPA